MEILVRMVKGVFVGTFTYAISFYSFVVLSAYIVRGELDFGGEWGGFIAAAIIGFIVGGIIGCIISLANLTTKTVSIASLIIGISLMILLLSSSYSSSVNQASSQLNNSSLIFDDIITCIICILMFVFNNWLINKSVLFKIKNNNIL